jgi:hypothetical protein
MQSRLLALCFATVSGVALAGEGPEKPAIPYYDWGACPFECCTYRTWIARVPVTIFTSRNEKSDVAFVLKKGERVRAITGVVVTYKFGVTKITQSVQIGYPLKGDKPVLSLAPGETLYTLHYVGEGSDLFWYKGSTYIDQISVPEHAWGQIPNADNVKVFSRPRYSWWAKVRNKSGQVGWTRKTDQFDNQDACG